MIINYSDQKVLKGNKSIFLAGPTPRDGKIKSWRTNACKYLEDNGFDGVVYEPEYSTMKPKVDYLDQVEWEREALSNASVIAFWIPRTIPDMPAFTTNVEFGYWIHTGKVLYGRPDSAEKVKYLDWLYKTDTNNEPYKSLEELLNASIELANKLGVNNKTKILPLDKRTIMKGNNYKINTKLKKYIEENVFPLYDKNEIGHGINHIKYVIKRSFELVKENNLDVNNDMVYVIAAYHDIGHHIDSKTHEIISADIMSKDKKLEDFFNEEELKTIKEAIEDHRASSKDDPRSIYGRIVSSADRNNTVEDCLRRTYTYGLKLDPNATDESLYLRAYDVLLKKFGEGGYAKFYFKDKVYENFLKDIRELLKDKDKFIETQKNCVNKLKEEGKI